MGILARLVPLARRARNVVDVLVARGNFIPANPETGQEEVVEPKGVLRSKTVGFALLGAVVSGIQIYRIFTAPGEVDVDQLSLAGGTFITSVGAIWARIVAWMPVRGPVTST